MRDGDNAYVKNTSELAEESLWQVEPHVDRVKILLSGLETINLGGIAEASLSSHTGRKAFCIFYLT